MMKFIWLITFVAFCSGIPAIAAPQAKADQKPAEDPPVVIDVQSRTNAQIEIQGDVFAGDSQMQMSELDGQRFSQLGDIDEDPFASGVPSAATKVAFLSPSLFKSAAFPDPRAFYERITRPIGFEFPGAPQVNAGKSRNRRDPRLSRLSGHNAEWTGDTGDMFAHSDSFGSGFYGAAHSPAFGDVVYGSTPDEESSGGMDSFSSSYAPDYVSAAVPKVGMKSLHPHWDFSRMPLKVYVSRSVEEARRGYVQSLIYESFRDWSRASGNKVRYTVTYNFRDADIYFVCEDTLNGEWADHEPEFHNGMFDRVKVAMSLQTLHDLEAKRLRAVCLHEVGHALGLLNHSNVKGDVMSLSAPDDFHPAIALTKNDISVFCKLYKD